MDRRGGNTAPEERDTEPFPAITPVVSASEGYNNNSSPRNTFTTTTTTTTPPGGRPTTTVTTQYGTSRPRPTTPSSPVATRPHSMSLPASARPPPQSPASPASARGGPSSATPNSPARTVDTALPGLYAQNRVRRKPISGAPVRRPSVRIKRQSSGRSLASSAASESPAPSRPTSYVPPASAGPSSSRPTSYALPDINEDVIDAVEASRRRSTSEPQRPAWALPQGDPLTRSTTAQQPSQLASVTEEGQSRDAVPRFDGAAPPQDTIAVPPQNAGVLRRLSVGARNAVKRRSAASRATASEYEDEELDPELVDILDVVDPEVSTLSTLTNVQNSLFIPDLGPLLNRQPTYTLSRRPPPRRPQSLAAPIGRPPPSAPQPDGEKPPEPEGEGEGEVDDTRPQLTHSSTISSTMTDSYYAVLPHGKSLAGWSDAEKAELNDHVRHMLHSRRSAFKRGMRGFGKYIRRPLGFFVTLYAVLITLFGAAWVLFLIGWINLGARRLYIINVIDNVLVALFAIMGDGLAPFRAWDTYNTIFVVHYWRVTRKLRKKKQLPKLKNKNDLPTHTPNELGASDADLEMQDSPMKDDDDYAADPDAFGEGYKAEYTVLNAKQQASLEKHQHRLARSHTFYKPHETVTHHAFPIHFLIAIVVLTDLHSCLQIALGTCTWSISYHKRPFALTTVILCCSITANITAGVVIMIGDRRTRKKDVLERMFRQQLTAKAMKKVEKRRVKTMEREQRDGLMGSVIHEDAGPSGSNTPGRRSMDKLRGSSDRLRLLQSGGTGAGTPTGAGSANQSSSSLRQVPSVPGVKVHLIE